MLKRADRTLAGQSDLPVMNFAAVAVGPQPGDTVRVGLRGVSAAAIRLGTAAFASGPFGDGRRITE